MPRVDITEVGGWWGVANLVSRAIEAEQGTVAMNRFLAQSNGMVGTGSDDQLLAFFQKHAVLILNDEVIGGEEVAESTSMVVVEDPKEFGLEAVEYLAAVENLDVVDAGYAPFVGFLADVKATLDAAETKRKDLTKGARETVDKINAEFKQGADAYKKAEGILKGKLLAYRAEINDVREALLTAGEDPIEPVPEVAGVRVSDKWKIEVDEALLPREYLMPDLKTIETDIKEGIEIPGVTAEKIEALAIEHRKVER